MKIKKEDLEKMNKFIQSLEAPFKYEFRIEWCGMENCHDLYYNHLWIEENNINITDVDKFCIYIDRENVDFIDSVEGYKLEDFGIEDTPKYLDIWGQTKIAHLNSESKLLNTFWYDTRVRIGEKPQITI